jgi:hypothetical protein
VDADLPGDGTARSGQAGSRIKNLAADVKVISRSFVVFGVSFPQVKNKSFRFTRSIRANHFDPLLDLIRFSYEIVWSVLDPYRLDTPSVPEDR